MSKIRCTFAVILLLLPLLLSAAEESPRFGAISSLVADPSGMSLWALANSRLCHSSDGGSNWQALRLELHAPVITRRYGWFKDRQPRRLCQPTKRVSTELIRKARARNSK